ncbi:MAG: D-alanyl-D-alanine carboxypeptidase, partial [Pseudomonadota bacterium]
ISFSFLITALAANAAYSRTASIVIDFESGEVLHSLNADTRNYPASLTKMMTLYVAFDAIKSGKLKMSQRLKVSRRAAAARPSKLGLKAGSTITTQDAILAMLTKSANDASVVIAEAIAGSERKFGRLMTQKAKSIGMRRSNFRNASGLPNRRQLSTARDMSTLAKRLLTDYPQHYKLFSTTYFEYGGRRYRNHNALLRTYPGVDGMKTGYTRASGYNLVVSAERDGRRIIGVVFGGRSSAARNTRMRKLLDKAFAKLQEPPKKSAPPIAKVAGSIGGTSIVARKDTLRKPETPTIQQKSSVKAGWGIQVGAFRNDAPARNAATEAVSQLRQNIRNSAQIVVVPVKQGNVTIYRARLVGLSRSAANEACRRLQSRKLNCVPVPPGT